MSGILKNLKFKVAIPVLILLGVMVAVGYTSVSYLSRMQGLNDALTERFHEIDRVRHMEFQTMEIMHLLLNAEVDAANGIGDHHHIHNDMPKVEEAYQERMVALRQLAGDLHKMDEVIVPAERELLTEIHKSLDGLDEAIQQFFRPDQTQKSSMRMHEVSHHHLEPMLQRFSNWHAQELAQVDGINRESEVVIESFRNGLILYSALSILTLALAFVYYHMSLTRRILSIRNGTQALTRGDFGFHINVHGDDELNTVASDINKMAEDLADYRNRLATLARTDELTGLANRRALDEILYKELARAQRRGRKVAIMMVDLDRFKNINDTWGHEVGDQALIHTAVWLESEVRQDELVFRLGGEEFVVFLPEVEPGDALIAAERIRKRIEDSSFMTDGQVISFTTSIGIAESGANGYDLRKMMNYADRALYAAKREGRNRCIVYESL